MDAKIEIDVLKIQEQFGKKLRTASLISKFTGSCKKSANIRDISPHAFFTQVNSFDIG